MNEFSNRTKLAIVAAKNAGMEIKKILDGENIGVKAKGLNDVLTIADVKSESLIVERILGLFKDDSIISEEEGKYKEGNSGYTWVIDPLDGTLNYSRNIPYYCVSIGYMKDGKPEGGAIYIPEFDELYYCERGKGAYLDNKKIKVSDIDSLSKSLTTIGFNNRYPEEREFFNRVHANCMENMVNAEKIFSTVVALCYVAVGKIESHFELNCYLWDICVGSLLVEEAGGKCSSLGNKELDFSKIDKQKIVATNGLIHENFVDLLK